MHPLGPVTRARSLSAAVCPDARVLTRPATLRRGLPSQFSASKVLTHAPGAPHKAFSGREQKPAALCSEARRLSATGPRRVATVQLSASTGYRDAMRMPARRTHFAAWGGSNPALPLTDEEASPPTFHPALRVIRCQEKAKRGVTKTSTFRASSSEALMQTPIHRRSL